MKWKEVREERREDGIEVRDEGIEEEINTALEIDI